MITDQLRQIQHYHKTFCNQHTVTYAHILKNIMKIIAPNGKTDGAQETE